MSWRSTRVCAFAVGLLLGAAMHAAAAPESASYDSSGGANVAAGGNKDAESEKVLRSLATPLEGVKNYRKDVTCTARLRGQGASSRLNHVYTITFEPPNKLSAVARARDAAAVVCDGKELFVQVPSAGKFAVDKAPASIADIVTSSQLAGAEIGHPVLLAGQLDLLPPDVLLEQVTAAKYLGQAKVGTTKCHHLEVTIEPYDFELWVDEGDKPRLRKVVAKLDRWIAQHSDKLPKEAKIDMTLAFRNWSSDVKLAASAFKFTPAEGLTQVTSLGSTVASEGPDALLDRPAPLFQLGLVSGGAMNLASHKGKDVVILDFWATWCGPCVKGLPTITEVAGNFKSKGVVFYAVNLREGPDEILPFLQEKSLPITVAMDSDGGVAKLYKVKGIPQTVIIGKDGTVQAIHVGFGEGVKERLTSELESLVAGKSIATRSQ